MKTDVEVAEYNRVKALESFTILDTAPEQDFDDIVRLASLICETPVSLISLVDMHRQWFKSSVGFETRETARDIAFCNCAIQEDDIMIVPDACKDDRFMLSPLVTGPPNIRFYAGVPLSTSDGFRLGTLCVMDSKPRILTSKQVFALRTLAKQVLRQLELRKNVGIIEVQKASLLKGNQELYTLNQELIAKEEEKRSNLEQISDLQSNLEIRESQYRGLVENATDLIYELDSEGRFTFVNTVMERITGYSREEFSRMTYWEMVDHSHYELVGEFYRNQRKGCIENTYLEFKMQNRSGTVFWIGQSVHMLFREDGYVFKVCAISRDITALKETEQKLESSERRFRLLSDSSPVGVLQTDVDGRCTYVNKRWSALTGLTESESLGLDWERAIHHDHRHLLFSHWKDTLSILGEYVTEVQMAVENEKIRWVNCKVNQITGTNGRIEGYIATIDDITELKEIHNKLSKREELYRLLSTNSKDLITLFHADADATRIFVSPSSRQILGYDPDELIGKSLFDLVQEEDKAHVTEITQAMTLNGKPATIEYRVRRNDGVMIWMESNSHPYFDAAGNMIGFQTSARDITRRKEFERSLQESKARAEEATMAKSQFLSMMSHEIRTPMNAIIGLTNLLLQQNAREDQKESLLLLKFSGENLLTIINDILDFSKIEAGKIVLESRDFDLHASMKSIKSMLEHSAKEKELNLILSYDEKLPRQVRGDSVRLCQAITNLVGNAVKFTESGHVSLSLTPVEGSQKIHFAIADTGIGISPDKIESIFERFSQADSDTTRKFGGTGLGLSITRSLVALMGGEVCAESNVGKGSTFSFSIALEESHADMKYSGGSVASDVEEFSSKPIHVLLVEDNRVNQIVASGFLKAWGIKMDIANNGLEAVAMVRNTTYDLVLMDLQMPVMDGYEATQNIRALNKPYFKQLPIVALTASAMLGMRDKALEVGMNDFISKPFVPANLKATIHKFVFQNSRTAG